MRKLPVLAAAILAAPVVRGDIVPLQASQAMAGSVDASAFGIPHGPFTFSEYAPDPLASWLPPDQHLFAESTVSWAVVDSTYASIIAPNRIALTTTVHADNYRAISSGPSGSYNYAQVFQLRFRLDVATDYEIAARLDRYKHNGWSVEPMTLSLTPVGQAPIVSLVLDASQAIGYLNATFDRRVIRLDPGEYTIQAQAAQSWSGAQLGIDAGMQFSLGLPCYADCDHSGTQPSLNIVDLLCFMNRFAAGDPYANCDSSTAPPVLTASDFACFLNAFAAGCS